MGKAKTRKSGTSSKQARSSPRRPLKQIDLAQIQEQITSLVSSHAVEMVDATIKQVDQGHYLAMKYLFKMIGLYPATAPEEAAQEDSLAKILLQRLGLPEEISAVTVVTRECVADPGEQDSDAVK